MSVFQSLAVRNYRLFASGQVVSNTGTWMQRVAQDWLVLQLSHTSGTAVGITTGLQFLPVALFGMFGGVVADRYPKRRVLMVTQASMGLCALALGLLDLAGVVALWHVYLLAFLLGVGTAFDNPTRQAFVSELVRPDRLSNAVALNSATFNAARIVGPAVAGLLIDPIGTGWVFVMNSASYLAVILALVRIRESDLFAGRRLPRRRGQLVEGLRYARSHADIMLPIVLAGVVGTFGFNYQMTMALMAKGVFHRTATGYGLLSTLLAVGSLTGALIAAARRRPRQRLLIGATLTFGTISIVSALMPTYWTFAATLIPTGLFSITFATAANTSTQLAASPVMRGRVMALYVLVYVGGTPLGAPLVGWVAQQYGARASLLLGGTVSLAAGVVAALWLMRRAQVRVDMRLRPHPQLLLRERAIPEMVEAK